MHQPEARRPRQERVLGGTGDGGGKGGVAKDSRIESGKLRIQELFGHVEKTHEMG